MDRPVLQNLQSTFTPSLELGQWVRETFINPKATLFNPEHQHLQRADIGYVWTTVENIKSERRIVGSCEVPNFRGSKWQIERQKYQLEEWFGEVPDFVITLDALALADFDDMGFCAVIEHELYHAGEAKDKYGFPIYSRNGKQKYALRGHDYEGFVGTVRRYGITQADQKLIDFFEASKLAPLIGQAQVSVACGNCLR